MALGLNDVDVDGIKAIDKQVRENPALGKRTVKLRSSWQRGVKALVEIGAQESSGRRRRRRPGASWSRWTRRPAWAGWTPPRPAVGAWPPSRAA